MLETSIGSYATVAAPVATAADEGVVTRVMTSLDTSGAMKRWDMDTAPKPEGTVTAAAVVGIVAIGNPVADDEEEEVGSRFMLYIVGVYLAAAAAMLKFKFVRPFG